MTETVSEQFAKQIRKRRNEKKLTLQQIEDSYGIQVSHLSSIETGKIKPSLNTIERILEALNANVQINIMD